MRRQGQSPQRQVAGQRQKKKKKKGGQKPTPKQDKEEQLRYLQDVFKDHIEPTLVHSLFDDYNADVTKVLETLVTLVDVEGDANHREIPSFKDITEHLTRGGSDSGDDSGHSEEEETGHVGDDDRGIDIPGHRPVDRQPTGHDSSLDLPLLPQRHEHGTGSSPSRGRDGYRDGSAEVETQKSPLSYHTVRYDDDGPGIGNYHRTPETLDSLLAGARDMTNQYGYDSVRTVGYHPTGSGQRTVDDILAEANRGAHSEYGSGAYMAPHNATTAHNVNGYNYNGPSQGTAGISAHYTTASSNLHGYSGQMGGSSYVSTFYGNAGLRHTRPGLQQGHPYYAPYSGTTVSGDVTYNHLGVNHNRWSTQEKASNLGKTPTSSSSREQAPARQKPDHGEVPTQSKAWPKKASNIIPRDRSGPREKDREPEPLPRGKVLCLMRGVPGSGKSTLARKLLPSYREGTIISTDDYFRKGDGSYVYNSHHLDRAHESAQRNAERAMERGQTPIIIDNTNTQLWEMKIYVHSAQKHHYKIEVREPNTPWKTKAAECARRNAHGVPPEKIQRMLDRFEPLHGIESILRAPDKKRANQEGRRQEFRNHHDRGNNPGGRSSSPHVTGKPKDVNVRSEKNSFLEQTVRDDKDTRQDQHRPPPTGQASSAEREPKLVSEGEVIASASQPESSRPPGKETGSKSMSGSGGSVTRSNLSETESIPIAPNLQDRVESFQKRLAEFGDFEDLIKSSDEPLPGIRSDESTGQKDKKKTEHASANHPSEGTSQAGDNYSPKQRFPGTTSSHKATSSEEDRSKQRHSHPQSGASDDHKNGGAAVREPGSHRKTDGSRISGSSIPTKYLTHSEPAEESLRREDRLVGSEAPRSVEPVRALEAGTDRQEPEAGDPSSSLSGGKSSGSRYGSASNLARPAGSDSHRTATNHGHTPTSRKAMGSKSETDLTKERLAHTEMEGEHPRDVHGNTPPGSERNTTGRNVGSKELKSPHSSDDGSPSDRWEAKGAKPKISRAVSEPSGHLSAEDPGPRLSSPEGDMRPSPFMSLATVPQMKKRRSRAATPIGRRTLAASFPTPALPSVSERAKLEPVAGGRGGASRSQSDVHELRSPDELSSANYGESDARPRRMIDGNQQVIGHRDGESGLHGTPSSHQRDGGASLVPTPSPGGPTPTEETSKTKSQSVKRKVARSRRVHPPPPLLSPETKEKALTQNWGLNAITKEVVPPLEAFPREPARYDPPEMKNQTSQTDSSHFRAVRRLNILSDAEPARLGDLRVVRVGSVPWKVDTPVGEAVNETIPHRRKIDRGSMTEDDASEMSQEMSLKALCDIFPQVGRDEMKRIFDDCSGNAEIASEFLLSEDHKAETARERRRREKAGKKLAPMTEDQSRRGHPRMASRESQTRRSDLLLARLIKDGYQADADLPADMRVLSSRYWIPAPASGGVGTTATPMRRSHVVQSDVGTIAEFGEGMPDFDANLSKLLLAHSDVPFLEVCDILEVNRGDVDKADREIKQRYSDKSEAGHQEPHQVPDGRLGNRPDANHGEDIPMTGGPKGRVGRMDSRPEPLGQPLTPDSLEDEDKASLSDQESHRLQRGRSVQSERGVAQVGSARRRTRSLPRKGRPSSPRPEEKTRTKDIHRSPPDIKRQLRTPDSIMAGSRMAKDGARRAPNSMMAGLPVRKEEVRMAEGKNQPKPSGLGRHLSVGKDGLPSKYSFDVHTKRDERGNFAVQERATGQENHREGNQAVERAEDLLKAGDKSTKEGGRVPMRRAQGSRAHTPQPLTEGRQKGQDDAPTSSPGAQGGVAIPGVTEGVEERLATPAGAGSKREKSDRVQDEDSREGEDVASGGAHGAQGGVSNLEQREGRQKHLDAATKVDKGRATPAELLDEEGKGVPARFHAGMTFQLDMAFALQLHEIFGSVGFNIDTDVLDEADLAISVDLELAKTLHAAWSKSFRQKFDQEEKQLMQMMKQDGRAEDDPASSERSKQKAEEEKKKQMEMIKRDEALAKELQQEEREEQKKQLEEFQRKREAKYRGQSPSTGSPVRGRSTPLQRQSPMGAAAMGGGANNLQEIMDTEMAQEISRDMQEEDAADKSGTMAVNLRRKQLRGKYPGTDESWLENIFMINHFDFEATVESVDAQIGVATGPRNVFSAEALQREEDRRVAQALEESQNFEPVGAEGPGQIEADELEKFKSGNFQSLGHPGYRDYRAEANQHYQQRQECFRKASEAFRKGQRDLAAHYSQQGHRHTALLQEANKRASEAILADTNKERDANTIDLHGLHVDEAITILQQKIEDLRLNLTYASAFVKYNPYLEIITGRGNNSKGGVARIKPAVIKFLKTKHIRYELMNAGLIRIKVM